MVKKIKIIRGIKKDFPTLDIGDLGYCTDSNELYAGSDKGNKLLTNSKGFLEIDNYNFEYSWEGNRLGIKRDSDSQYSYVNLNEENGDTGTGSFLELINVDSVERANNSLPMYNLNTQKLKPESFSKLDEEAISLGILSDVDVSSTPPRNGNVLKYEDGVWKSAEIVCCNCNIILENWIEGSELVQIEDSQAPLEVTSLTAKDITKTSLTLNWIASASSDIHEYKIYKQGNFIGSTTGTSFTVSELTADTEYIFLITSIDTSGNESEGVNITVRTESETYYLKLSGENSRLSINIDGIYNKIEVRCRINSPKNNPDTFYKDWGNPSTYSIISGANRNISKIIIDDVTITGNLGNSVKLNEDTTITHILTSPVKSGGISLFGENIVNSIPGNIYSITLYNHEEVIAKFDTSKGNLIEQSGSGYSATVIGTHTWVPIM